MVAQKMAAFSIRRGLDPPHFPFYASTFEYNFQFLFMLKLLYSRRQLRIYKGTETLVSDKLSNLSRPTVAWKIISLEEKMIILHQGHV